MKYMKRIKTYQQLDELGLLENLYNSDISFYKLVDDDGNLVDKYGEPLD